MFPLTALYSTLKGPDLRSVWSAVGSADMVLVRISRWGDSGLVCGFVSRGGVVRKRYVSR